MNRTKTPIVITLLLVLFTSCLNSPSGAQTSSNSQASNTIQLNGKTYTLKENVDATKLQYNKKVENNIVFHKFEDSERNMTIGYLPLPSDWILKDKPDNEGAQIFGPNNIKVFLPRNNDFVYSQLPGFNQMAAQMGQQIKPLQSLEQMVKVEFVPLLANDGVKLIKQYKVPQLKAYDENYEQFVFKPVPMQKTFEVLATEWLDKDNNSVILIIRQYITYTQEACYWGYILNVMKAPKAYFEDAKIKYLYALEYTKYNPQWLHTRYMEDAKESARLGKLHEDRMRSLIAEGEAIVKRGEAHSAMVDRNHKRFMDTHLERQTVTNTASGKSYQVDAGSKDYWINSDGEYIPSDNVHFDPNFDPNLNNQTWTKAQINN
ncbi:hypothetical protein EV196_101504 [Mariniflexile fucanivorans]|uniref:Uncharacterized protein n=1 Tax=Mariniflexile fucanivorans TaxID=264023 RepID=A0A4R1RRL8_9FLAO|nr:hypothetical protein [Mariniflexile fucanivorans]TCL69073.1 hypothetical protein EV196_101504 [Mariniflexile fucanivorans]